MCACVFVPGEKDVPMFLSVFIMVICQYKCQEHDNYH